MLAIIFHPLVIAVSVWLDKYGGHTWLKGMVDKSAFDASPVVVTPDEQKPALDDDEDAKPRHKSDRSNITRRLQSSCAAGCASSWVSDGECDSICNVASCNYDGNDCAHRRRSSQYYYSGYSTSPRRRRTAYTASYYSSRRRLVESRRRTTTRGYSELSDGVYWAITLGSLGVIFILNLIWLISACMFKSSVTDRRPNMLSIPPECSMAGGRPFKYNCSGCFEDGQACQHGCFCFEVLIADIYHSQGIMNFWLLFFIWCLILSVCSFLGQEFGSQWVMMCAALMMAYLRGKLRRKMGSDSPLCPGFFIDFLCWWWCPCCSIIQEARHVNDAQSVKVECCCKLTVLTPITSSAVSVVPAANVVVGAPVQAVVVPGAIVSKAEETNQQGSTQYA